MRGQKRPVGNAAYQRCSRIRARHTRIAVPPSEYLVSAGGFAARYPVMDQNRLLKKRPVASVACSSGSMGVVFGRGTGQTGVVLTKQNGWLSPWEKHLRDAHYFREQARGCRALSKTAIEPEVIEQFRVWSVELADEADETERRCVPRRVSKAADLWASFPPEPILAMGFKR